MIQKVTDRQLQIIAAAGRILTASGVGGLTIKNLASEMQFSESAIYRHFSSKESIVIAMLDYLADSMDERYNLALAPDLTPEEKLITLFRNQLTFFQDNPHFVVAVFSDGLMDEKEQINLAIKRIMSVKMKHLKPIIQQGQEAQVFTLALTTDELVHITMGSFRLQMYKWRMENFEYDITSHGERLIKSILKLIKTQL